MKLIETFIVVLATLMLAGMFMLAITTGTVYYSLYYSWKYVKKALTKSCVEP